MTVVKGWTAPDKAPIWVEKSPSGIQTPRHCHVLQAHREPKRLGQDIKNIHGRKDGGETGAQWVWLTRDKGRAAVMASASCRHRVPCSIFSAHFANVPQALKRTWHIASAL